MKLLHVYVLKTIPSSDDKCKYPLAHSHTHHNFVCVRLYADVYNKYDLCLIEKFMQNLHKLFSHIPSVAFKSKPTYVSAPVCVVVLIQIQKSAADLHISKI